MQKIYMRISIIIIEREREWQWQCAGDRDDGSMDATTAIRWLAPLAPLAPLARLLLITVTLYWVLNTHSTRQSVCHPCPGVRTGSCETSDPSTWPQSYSRNSTRPSHRRSRRCRRSWRAAAHTAPSCCSGSSPPDSCPCRRAAVCPCRWHSARGLAHFPWRCCWAWASLGAVQHWPWWPTLTAQHWMWCWPTSQTTARATQRQCPGLKALRTGKRERERERVHEWERSRFIPLWFYRYRYIEKIKYLHALIEYFISSWNPNVNYFNLFSHPIIFTNTELFALSSRK